MFSRKTLRRIALPLIAILLGTSVAQATGPWAPDSVGNYIWVGKDANDNGNFEDGNCTGSNNFDFNLLRNTNYGGDRVESCVYEPGACYVPLEDEAAQGITCGPAWWFQNAENKASSLGIVSLAYTWDLCFYAGDNYTGSYMRITSAYDDRSDLSLYGFNDTIQSWRKRHDGDGTTTYQAC